MSTPTDFRAAVEVVVLRWPEDAARRDELVERGVARLLLVGEGTIPPPAVDDLEDWVPSPYSAVELATRTEMLRARTLVATQLALEDDCVLRFRDRWVALTPQQVPVVRLLVDNVGHLVPFDRIRDAYRGGGGSLTPYAVRTLITRVRRRVATIGLELHVVRERGLMLDYARLPSASVSVMRSDGFVLEG